MIGPMVSVWITLSSLAVLRSRFPIGVAMRRRFVPWRDVSKRRRTLLVKLRNRVRRRDMTGLLRPRTVFRWRRLLTPMAVNRMIITMKKSRYRRKREKILLHLKIRRHLLLVMIFAALMMIRFLRRLLWSWVRVRWGVLVIIRSITRGDWRVLLRPRVTNLRVFRVAKLRMGCLLLSRPVRTHRRTFTLRCRLVPVVMSIEIRRRHGRWLRLVSFGRRTLITVRTWRAIFPLLLLLNGRVPLSWCFIMVWRTTRLLVFVRRRVIVSARKVAS